MINTVWPPGKIFRLASIAIFPIITIAFAAVYVWDVYRYLDLLREDNWIEWLTFACLIVAGLLSWDIAIQVRQREQVVHWFYIAFGLFCLFVALEEISWGERVFSLQPVEFFLGRSDQQEINVHNVLQQQLDFKTKDVAALVLAGYGLIMPLLALNKRITAYLKHLRFVVPPRFLMVGFFLATMMMLDVPTGWEEELGEFFFALCFLLFMIWELGAHSPNGQLQPFRIFTLQSRISARSLDRLTVGMLILLAFAIRVWRIDYKGLWLDEAANALAAQAGIQEIIEHIWRAATLAPPAWPLLLHVWISIGGLSEVALRFLPALAGVLSVPLVWQLLRTVEVDDWALRTLVALLVALSPSLLYYAQDGAAYSFLITLALLSLYAALRLVKGPALRWFAVFVIANWLLLSFHLFTITLLLAEILFFALSAAGEDSAGRRKWAAFGTAVLLSLLPFALWALFAPQFSVALELFQSSPGSEDWSMSDRLARIWRDLIFGSVLWQPIQAIRAYLLIPLVLLGAWVLLWQNSTRDKGIEKTSYMAWSWLLLGSILIPFLAAGSLFQGLPSGVLVVVVPGLMILLSMGILYLWRRVRLIGLAGLALALLVAVGGITWYFDSYQKSAYEEMAGYMDARAQTSDGILLETHRQYPLAQYYLGDYNTIRPVPFVDLPQYWPAPVTPVIPEEVDDPIQQLLREHPSVWLILYGEKEADPNSFVRQYLTAVSHRVECSEWLDLELCQYASPYFWQPAVQEVTSVLYADELLLQDIAVGLADSRRPEQPFLLLTMNWLAESQPSIAYKVSVRLLDELGNVVVQRDEFPIGPLLPPTSWQAGDEKPGHIALQLPEELSPGQYSVETVVYDAATAASLPFTIGGERKDGESITLALIDVADGIQVLAAD